MDFLSSSATWWQLLIKKNRRRARPLCLQRARCLVFWRGALPTRAWNSNFVPLLCTYNGSVGRQLTLLLTCFFCPAPTQKLTVGELYLTRVLFVRRCAQFASDSTHEMCVWKSMWTLTTHLLFLVDKLIRLVCVTRVDRIRFRRKNTITKRFHKDMTMVKCWVVVVSDDKISLEHANVYDS